MPFSGFSGFDDLVGVDGIAIDVVAASKSAALAAVAAIAAVETGITAAAILERVEMREALGSTGFGGGAAIPHARFADLPGVHVVVARLAQPVDFAAIDGAPVDIVVLLLSPEAAGADHLKALARISRTLRDPVRLERLRAATDVAGLREALQLVEAPRQAA